MSHPLHVVTCFGLLLLCSYASHGALALLIRYERHLSPAVKKTITDAHDAGPVTLDPIWNSMLMMVNAFYPSITALSLTLFHCFRHPDGTLALRAFYNVECYSAQWNTMLPFAIAAIALYSVGFYTLIIVQSIRAPQQVAKC